jgi:hypothetical protein
MAGSGRRVFSPGEVLTASNTMNYLMDQTVMNFAGTAARGSAIGTAVAEGMVSYLADTNDVQVYDGSSWNDLAFESYVDAKPVSGLVPIVPTTVTVGSGSSSIGATGKVTLTTVGTSFSLNGVFSSSYENYKVVMQGVTASATALTLRFRAAGTDRSGANYDWVALVADATGPRQARNTGQTSITTSLNVATNHTSEMLFYTPNVSGILTRVKGESLSWATGNVNTIGYTGLFNTAQVDDGFTLLTSANFTGTIQVFGFN